MKQRKTENFILFLISLACIGVTIVSVLLRWEFWVPPLIIIGTVLLWVMNLSERPEYGIREIGYLLFAMLVSFFHGIHVTSFYDAAIVIAFIMVAYSFLNHVYMMNLLLAEYVVILLIQLYLASHNGFIAMSVLNVSRIVLYLTTVCLCYFCCIRSINDRLEALETEAEKDERIESYDADMEDFLSNISHELRTPVNVVSGMSDLLIKRHAEEEAYTIKDAGIRLAYQIEDIQDYTECKRKKVMLEEEEYMSISLINDVVSGFRIIDNVKNLELVVDLDPAVPSRMRGDIKKLHKIFRHLLENAVKFTRRGGIYVRMYSENTDSGMNLCIEVTDTGIGMDRKAIDSVAEGMYQVNKKRNRSSGGIGLGLFIVYGFAHRMEGFVKIESEKDSGTTVRVTIPQDVTDDTPCLTLSHAFQGDILFHVKPDKYKVPRIRDFHRYMATNLASGVHVPLYSAESVNEIERLIEKLNVSTIFMGQEEYKDNPEYFDRLSMGDTVVAVSAGAGFRVNPGSRVIVMPKPLYACPVIKILNDGRDVRGIEYSDDEIKPVFKGVRALIVDDEPMNLVVATSLFADYKLEIDTAGSGKEAVKKYRKETYDLVFMDHMMPEMDGVETMKRIKKEASELNKTVIVVALTANAVSGAKEMFMREGFDGFIAKPINIVEFERTMKHVLPEEMQYFEGRND